MIDNFTGKELHPSVYLLENLYNKSDDVIILKEFKNFEESQKNWEEAFDELVNIAEENRDRFFYIKGDVRQKDGSIKLQSASW